MNVIEVLLIIGSFIFCFFLLLKTEMMKKTIIFFLVERLFSGCSIDNWKKKEQLANKDKGLVTEAVLNKLYKLHKKGQLEKYILNPGFGDSFFWSLQVLEETASSKDAFRIATILEWNELYLGEGRSSRNNRRSILAILEKIGGKKEIKYVNAYAEKVKEIKYEIRDDHFFGIFNEEYAEKEAKFDQEAAQRTISTLKKRDLRQDLQSPE